MYNHFLYYLQRSIRNCWNEPALTNYKGITYTYGEVAVEIARYHVLFERIGIRKGDHIALCARNCAEWGIVFLAVSSYQAVVVSLLNDFTTESIQSLTEHSESIVLFTEAEKWEKMVPEAFTHLQYAFSLPDKKALWKKDIASGNIIPLRDGSPDPEGFFMEWEKAFGESNPCGFSAKDVNYPTNNFEELALINYTSGTTSAPKGVMLSYGNISSNIEFGQWGIPNHPGESIVSMLPLAHMYGLAFEFLYQLAGGCHVVFLGKLPSPNVLFRAFAEVKPYMIVTVPLVIEKVFKASVFPTLEKPKMKWIMKIPLLKNLVYQRIHDKILLAFGGELRYMIIGGAAINAEVEDMMKSTHLPYTIGYGMTECGPILGYADWKRFRKGSCGRAVHRMALRIDSDDQSRNVGEIQAKGDNVMMGYYKNEEATKAAFTADGWLRTGDLGIIDPKGNVFIRGRSKNMILSSNGQNIYPEEIEDKLNNQPYVVESIVVERDKKIVALVFPDRTRVSQEALDENGLAKIMEENRLKLNLLLPNYSKISKIELVNEEFEKTPKRSIKRFLYK